MRLTVFCLGFVLSGCANIPQGAPAPLAGEAASGAPQAYFAHYPDHLFRAATEVCDAPGQRVITPNRHQVRCESLPDPDAAAALILQFNGTVDALPRFVVSFSGRAVEQGYLVTADSYIRVPQRSGPAQQLRFASLSVGSELSDLLEAAGGRPL